ncbi:MAG TPA: hypothetical protein VGK50_01480 [Coriobacteriia bacterium]|jgi:hypothetical protein
MEHATVHRIVEWAEREFAGDEWVQKDQVLAAARRSDLPDDAKRALRELPQARWPKRELLYLLGGLDKPQTRPDMSAPPDGVPGGGHEGESEVP